MSSEMHKQEQYVQYNERKKIIFSKHSQIFVSMTLWSIFNTDFGKLWRVSMSWTKASKSCTKKEKVGKWSVLQQKLDTFHATSWNKQTHGVIYDCTIRKETLVGDESDMKMMMMVVTLLFVGLLKPSLPLFTPHMYLTDKWIQLLPKINGNGCTMWTLDTSLR